MPESLFSAVLLIAGLMFAVAFILTMWRILIGPNSLDRLIGLDGLVAMIQCMFATLICWTMDTTIANAMMVVALLGFISSVSVARFRKRDGS